MKKCISMTLIIIFLAACLSLSALAAPVQIECEDALELAGGSNVQDSEFASELRLIGLKPDEVGTDSFALYEISVSEDGKYTFTFTYTAAAGDDMLRKADISMDGVRSPLDLKQTDTWEVFDTISITFDLTAGKHELKLLSPSDYDNASVKTPNVDFFTYAKTGELAAAVVSEVIEETPKPVEVVEAAPIENIQPVAAVSPKTSDIGLIMFILLGAISGGALIHSTLKSRVQ